MTRKFSPSSNTTRGFILVIALSLMALIVLLILTFSTHFRVETSQAVSQAAMISARQNALLALQAALADLQQATGPDQRSTASASVQRASNDDFNGVGSRHWTAVWDTVNRELIGYLVPGGIHASTENQPDPFTPIDPAQLTTLVGSGSAAPENQVSAPRQSISPSGTGPAEHISWWIGDLSLRTKVSPRPPPPPIVSGSPDYLHAQRSAVEAVFPGDLRETLFDRLVMQNQLPFVQGDEDFPLRQDHFHDLTFFSRGLLTDASFGGLRGNLAAAFEGNMADLFAFHASRGGEQIFGPQRAAADDLGGPRWSQLRSYYQLPSGVTGAGAAAQISPVLPSDTEGGISPIPLHLQFWVHASLVTAGPDRIRTRLHVLPRIALWNPYNVTLRGRTYYFSWREPTYPNTSHNNNINVHLAYNLPDEPVRSTILSQSIPFQFNQAIRINLPDLAPGEVVILTPQADSNVANLILTPGDRDTYYFLDHPNTLPLPPSAENVEIRISGYYNFENIPAVPSRSEGNQSWMVMLLGPTETSVTGNRTSQRLNQVYHTIRNIPVWGMNNWLNANSNRTTYLANTPYDPSEVPSLNGLFGFGGWPTVGFYVSKRQPENLFQNNAFRRLPWLAHFNPRGRLSGRAPQDLSLSPVTNTPTTTVNSVPGYVWATSVDRDFYDTEFRSPPNVGFSDYWGPERTILFEVPRRKSEVLSLGSLTHANLSLPAGNSLIWDLAPNYNIEESAPLLNEVNRPAYPLGNSLADPHLGEAAESDLAQLSRIFRDFWPNIRQSLPANATAYDWSYLLNKALFDSYFMSTATPEWLASAFSSWVSGGPLPRLPQARFELVIPEGEPRPGTPSAWTAVLTNFNTAAAFIAIDGAFNVNSTSVEAWEAELAGLLGANTSLGDLGSDEVPFARFSFPPAGAFAGDSNLNPAAYAGYRKLSRAEIRSLAEAFVLEIRDRGPALTIADFINRDPASNVVAHRLRGRIAGAIERTSINGALQDPFSSRSDYDNAPQANHSYRDFATLALESPRLRHSAAYLSSADIVSRIGANWTARGDTFVIRFEGTAANSNGSDSLISVFGEAVVQRVISLTGSSTGGGFEPTTDLGRSYRIISFRWLSPDEV